MDINVGDETEKITKARRSMHENETYGKEGKGTHVPTMKL
jgi:hypothetical protein